VWRFEVLAVVVTKNTFFLDVTTCILVEVCRCFGGKYFLHLQGLIVNELRSKKNSVKVEKRMELYSSPNIIRMIKTRRMRWSGHVACMGEKRNAYRIFDGRARKK
jgi:hypothetical protein